MRTFLLSIILLFSLGQLYAQSGFKMILTKNYYNDFETASKNAIVEVHDGDSLWLNIHTDKPLSNYIPVARKNQPDGSVAKVIELVIRIGAKENQNDYMGLRICFSGCEGEEMLRSDTKVDEKLLNGNDLRLCMTKFMPGKSSGIFLEVVGGGQPGAWENELRLYAFKEILGNNHLMFETKPFATVSIKCSVEDGIVKYKKMWNVYDESSNLETNELPAKTNFSDVNVQKAILQKLAMSGIKPVRTFFIEDDWRYYDESSLKRFRKIRATYTYKKNGQCYFGFAEAIQNLGIGSGNYGPAQVDLYQMDRPLQCNKL